MSLHHGHHLRLQLLQFVLMLLLGFFIGSHQVAVWGAGKERKQTVIGLVWRHLSCPLGDWLWRGPSASIKEWEINCSTLTAIHLLLAELQFFPC